MAVGGQRIALSEILSGVSPTQQWMRPKSDIVAAVGAGRGNDWLLKRGKLGGVVRSSWDRRFGTVGYRPL